MTNSSISSKQFNVKIVLFQAIQFSIVHSLIVYLIDRTLSDSTTPGQIGSGSDGDEGVLHIPQSFSITRASPSDCLLSYARHLLGESYPTAKMQSVYSAAPVNWDRAILDMTEWLNGMSTRQWLFTA